MTFSDEQLERYARHIILREVGGTGQAALMNARVLVVGAGGLGAPMLMYLAAAGVGTLGIVDDDTVELSNLQRQIIHATPDIGASKAANAARRIADLNPDVSVNIHSVRLDAENAETLIAGYDIVADGSDNFATRHRVADTCVALDKTLVSAALGPFEGQVSTFKPHASKPDTCPPLPCYRCFIPQPPEDDSERTCSDRGILGAVAGVVGSLQALEVLKEITGVGDSLAGRLMLFDALTMTSRTIDLPRDPACPCCRDKGANGNKVARGSKEKAEK